MKRHSFIIIIVLCALTFILPALAPANDSGKWQFQLAPYAWLAGQKGSVATLPGLPAADIDVDFYDDIIGNINGAFFLVGEARKDRMGIFMDIAYTDIEDENATPGPFFSALTSRTKSWMITTTGLYRLVEEKQAFLDALAGLRYWSVDSTLALTSGILTGRDVSNKESWFDPVIGLKGSTPLGDSKFFVNGGLLLGGFNMGSDFMWDANLNFGYQWTQTFSTTLGYRYLDVNYEKDDFLYDVSQQGSVLGLNWQF